MICRCPCGFRTESLKEREGHLKACRGTLDDPTAFVTAQITDTNGSVSVVNGLVERNGTFWGFTPENGIDRYYVSPLLFPGCRDKSTVTTTARKT